MNRFVRKKGVVYNISYHVIWTPKYRSHILKGNIKQIVINALLEKANEIKIKIEKYEVMEDHIHLFIKAKPTHKISEVVRFLKGYSSYKVREYYPKYRKYKSFWSSSYYCETIGHISERTIKKYIDDQMQHHKNNSSHG
jgi:putative transposase